jgi:hypothetical protein
MTESISITLIFPGTPQVLKYERVSEVNYQSEHGVEFISRGTRIVSNLPYIIAYEKEISN